MPSSTYSSSSASGSQDAGKGFGRGRRSEGYLPRVDERDIGDLPERLKPLSVALAYLLRYDAYKAGWLDDENWMPVGQVIQELQRGVKGRQPVTTNESDLQIVVMTSFTHSTPRFELRICGGLFFLRAAEGEKYRQRQKKSGRKIQPSQRNSQGIRSDDPSNDRGNWSPRSNMSDVSGVSGFSHVSHASHASRASHASYASYASHASCAPWGGRGQRDHASGYPALSSVADPSARSQRGRVSTAEAHANHPSYDSMGVPSAVQSAAHGSSSSASDVAAAFDGAWCLQHVPDRAYCRIDGRVLSWEGHKTRQELRIRKESIALLSKHGKPECFGRLVSGQLHWDDGDVWQRATAPAGAAGQEEGSVVTYPGSGSPSAAPSAVGAATAEQSRPSTFDMRGAGQNDDSVEDPDWDEMRATVDFNGSAYGSEYLSFNKGELLQVRRTHEEGWALARFISRDGDQEGWVPPAYLVMDEAP